MLFELTIVPVTGHAHISGEIAEALKIIDAAGLAYRLMPTGTCIEGTWDEVMPVIRRCHDHIRKFTPYVVTTISIEDKEGAQNLLEKNIASVEEKLGHPVKC